MDSMTISQVSREIGISTRMLRYYEQVGLIASSRREGYAYRIYDDAAVARLRQILLLRKLRIPVRQIKIILQNPNAPAAIRVFQQSIRDLDEEITALSTIQAILRRLVEGLSPAAALPLSRVLSQDETLLASIEALGLISINFKEEQMMGKLKKADESLSKLRDVRIVYLPPATVAAAHYVGDDPENHVNGCIDQFVRQTRLYETKPDLRHYGFNHPNPVDATGCHGYEAWVTIPAELEVPPPLVKKHFAGGLYAAHAIAFGNFNEWDALFDWVRGSEAYVFAGDIGDQAHMCGMLEERLNYISHLRQPAPRLETMQLDLLIPIKER